MAIFTAENYGGAIEKCLLNKKDVTRLATCASIPGPDLADMPPPAGVVMDVLDGSRANIRYHHNEDGTAGVLRGLGWVDLLDTTEEGYPYFIVGDDDEPMTTRHHGIIRLEWLNA